MKSILRSINQLIRLKHNEPSSPPFWKGAFTGLLVLSLTIMAMSGMFYRTGIPLWLVSLSTFAAGALAFWLLRVVGALLHRAITRIPPFVFSVFFAAVGTLILARFIRFGLPDQVFYIGSVIFITSFTFLFGSGYLLLKKKGVFRFFHLIAFSFSIICIAACIYFLYQEGHDPYKINYEPIQVSLLSEKGIVNPGANGAHAVISFTYGSGSDKRRKEYNQEVRFISKQVDASRLLPEWKGSKAKWREKFWGFGVKSFPLNGRVWMPAEKLNCPLILIVHGNHGMEEFSDPGYAYLGELLASRGFIVVSVDENFINATWSGDFRGKEMPARGWLLLKHLEQWREWTSDSQHELFKKADVTNVILAGHSRGGEAAPIAAQFNKLPYYPDDATEKFDFNFGIKGVVSIAPTDKRYDRRMKLENINYLSIQGSYDSDEASFFGYRQFQRIAFSDSSYFKAGLYIHGANHGQFNTTWGKYDGGAPFKWLLNTAPQIAGEDQMQIAKVYVSAFAEAVANGNRQYLDLFINSACAVDWLPNSILINTFEDSKTQKLVSFEEDIDVTTGTWPGTTITSTNLALWREETLQFRDKDTQANNALVLGWSTDSTRKSAGYEINFSTPISLKNIHSIMMSMAPGNVDELNKSKEQKDKGASNQPEPQPNFQLQLVDTLGNVATIESNKLKKLKPRLNVQFVKLKGLHDDNFGAAWEPTLETFEFPLSEFDNQNIPLSWLKQIKFNFGETPKAVLILDDISLRRK